MSAPVAGAAMPLADWVHEASSVGRRGVSVTREASAAELKALAEALGLPAMGGLGVRYRLAHSGTDRFTLDGEMIADVVQTCVVSLEPLAVKLRLPLEAIFSAVPEVPVSSAAKEAVGEPEDSEILGLADLEPIEDGSLSVGRVVYETMAAGLDPYPRKPGAEFDWSDPKSASASPFAALAKLKREP